MEPSLFLRTRREALNLSQNDLAFRLAGYGFLASKSTISHWELGRNRLPLDNPDFRTALALSLDMDITEMLQILGYEISVESRSKEARQAADIVDTLPKPAQDLALDYLKLLKERFIS